MWETMRFWKLGIYKTSTKATMALINSLITTLNGAQWSDFNSSQKFVAVGAAIVAMLQVIDAFFSNTIDDLKKKQEAVDGNRTERTTSTTVSTETKP